MTATRNLTHAAAAYEGFSTGNMDPLFSQLHPNIIWTHHDHEDVPLTGVYKGQQGVMEYFGHMPEIELEKFEVIDMIEKDNRIVVIIDSMRTIKATGKKNSGQAVHVLKYEGGQLIAMDTYSPMG